MNTGEEKAFRFVMRLQGGAHSTITLVERNKAAAIRKYRALTDGASFVLLSGEAAPMKDNEVAA